MPLMPPALSGRSHARHPRAAAALAVAAALLVPGTHALAQDAAQPSGTPSAAPDPAPGDVTLDAIAAIVNEGVVTSSDVRGEADFLRRQSALEGQALPDDATLLARVRERLIDREVQRQHARRLGVSVDAATVNRAIEDVARRNNMDLAQLRDTLRSQGLDYERYRESIEHEVLLQRLVQRDVASGVRVSEQEIDDFIDALENDVAERRGYRLSHLLVRVPQGASEAERAAADERVRELLARLDAGEDFGNLAAAESDGARALQGGDLGVRTLSELPAFIASVVPGMSEGDTVGPIESASGLHVVRLVDIADADPRQRRETLVRHVFVAGDDENARRRVSDARARIASGESFGDVARDVSEDPNSASEGGELPWFGTGEMPSELEAAAADQPLGQVGEPFATRFGWHVLEVLERRERRVEDEQVRQSARETMRGQKIEEEADRWMRRLRDDSFVEVRS